MKIFTLFIFLFLFLSSFPLRAHEKVLVCFPMLDPTYRDLEFQIKPSQGTCGKDETIYEVKKEGDGVILFFPYDASPSTQPSPTSIPTSSKMGKSIF